MPLAHLILANDRPEMMLLVFSRDPGATERLIAVIESLEGPLLSTKHLDLCSMRNELDPLLSGLRIFSRPPGDAIWAAAGRSPHYWDSRSDEETADFLRSGNVAAVLTGVSDIDEPTDRILWRAARAARIPSHAIMDQRVNLRARFTDANSQITYPDWIYVPNDVYANALAGVGVRRQQIRVIGDLHLDRARRNFAAMKQTDLDEVRRSWNVGPERKLVLFISECGQEMAALGRPARYDELEQLQLFIAAIEARAAPTDPALLPCSTTIFIRPHPRDRIGKYRDIVGRRPSGLIVESSSLADPELAIAAADLVTGMNSSLLHRASLLGCRVYSITKHPLGDAIGAEC